MHRTIRATGIIVGPDGRPCLTDLDYAAAEPAAPSREQAPPGPDELALAAPEVFMGGAVPASDIYALGLAVCRGMTERDPAVLLREGARVRLRGALGVSEAFAAVLARMLEPSLERRYPDARALDADLARLAGVRGAPAQQPRGTGSRGASAPARRPSPDPGRRRPGAHGAHGAGGGHAASAQPAGAGTISARCARADGTGGRASAPGRSGTGGAVAGRSWLPGATAHDPRPRRWGASHRAGPFSAASGRARTRSRATVRHGVAAGFVLPDGGLAVRGDPRCRRGTAVP